MGRHRAYRGILAALLLAVGAPVLAQPGGAGDKVPKYLARIASEIDDARKVRPTLVVWLFDHSAGAQAIRNEVARNLGLIYKTSVATPPERAAPIQPLWSAVVSFAGDVSFPVREPIESYEEVWKAIDAIQDVGEAQSKILAAIEQAADEYLPFRKRRAWHVIFVIVSERPGIVVGGDGSSAQQVDSLVERFRATAVPVYVLGATVPFSTAAATALEGAPRGRSARGKSNSPAVSDCLHWDRIDLAYPGGANDRDLRNSGFGPWALANLCHESGGEFLGVRAMSGDSDTTFPPEYLRKYSPDYLSEKKFSDLLAANKCRQALLEASALPRTEVLQRPPLSFVKKDEAQLNNQLGQAQRAAAAVEPQIDKLHETLAAAEPDRERLTGARWQAGYDLAMGRALAAKARCDGYNAMLALLKQGKAFRNPQSTTWILKESDATSSSSILESLAKKSRLYLERVIQEHPGTPWAESAARELQTPLGWSWDEQ